MPEHPHLADRPHQPADRDRLAVSGDTSAYVSNGGAIRFGRYTLIGLLGRGGMGAVYSAYDAELARKVAIKLIEVGNLDESQAAARNDELHSRFLREARALAKLAHPNIVAIYDVGVAQGQMYYAMEEIEGQSLSQWLHSLSSQPAHRRWPAVVEMMLQAGAGLIAAHRAGLIHRDFKPANVLVDRQGRALVADFGLVASGFSQRPLAMASAGPSDARTSGPSATSEVGDWSQLGNIVGTPSYMSPEQHAGAAIDARSDLFSYCVSFFFALYGVLPFAGDSREKIAQAILRRQLHPLTTDQRRMAPLWLHALIVRGLAADPHDRYPDMESLLDSLRHGLARRQQRQRLGTRSGALGLAATLFVLAHTYQPHVDQPSCQAGTHSFGDVWNGEIYRQLTPMFVRFAPSQALWQRVGGRLDEYGNAWRNAYEHACEAHAQQADQPSFDPALFDQQMTCLAQARAQLDGLVRGWQSDDAPQADRAIFAVYRLPDPDFCLASANLQSSAPLPTDPVQRREVENLREKIVRSVGQWDAGQHEASLRDLLALKPAVVQVDDYALNAELASTIGLFYANISARHKAQTYLEQGLALARAGRYGKIAARSAISLIYVRVYQGGDLEHADELTEQARASLASSGDLPEYLASFYNQLGIVASMRGDGDRSLRMFEQAYQQNARFRGAKHPMSATYLNNLAESHYSLMHLQQAEQVMRQVIEISTQTYGPTHPEMIDTHRTFGLILASLGRYDEADASLQRAVELCDLNYEQTPDACRDLLVGIAQKWLETGADDLAFLLLKHVGASDPNPELAHIPSHDPTHDPVTWHSSWAFVATARGEWQAAREELERAQKAVQLTLMANHPTGPWLRLLHAQIDLGQGRPPRGLAAFAKRRWRLGS